MQDKYYNEIAECIEVSTNAELEHRIKKYESIMHGLDASDPMSEVYTNRIKMIHDELQRRQNPVA